MEASLRDPYLLARKRMVAEQLLPRGITDKKIISIMSEIPRHIFIDEALRSQAYADHPLSIGENQTISQPFIVALMTQALGLKGNEKILEIGTGCGYQTVLLSQLGRQVFTIERIKNLALSARSHLKALGLRNIVMRVGDGTKGWKEEAPFDAILVAAGSPEVPQPLLDQLGEGGKLVIPVGEEDSQTLFRFTKRKGEIFSENMGPCRFVKLVGEHGWEKKRL